METRSIPLDRKPANLPDTGPLCHGVGSPESATQCKVDYQIGRWATGGDRGGNRGKATCAGLPGYTQLWHGGLVAVPLAPPCPAPDKKKMDFPHLFVGPLYLAISQYVCV